jgi:hypothetical protein
MDIERIKAAADAATAKRGKRRGEIKAQCPAMGTDAAIYWQAHMSVHNPYKLSIIQLIFADRDFFDDCERYIAALHMARQAA